MIFLEEKSLVFGTFSTDPAVWQFKLLEDCRDLNMTAIVYLDPLSRRKRFLLATLIDTAQFVLLL